MAGITYHISKNFNDPELRFPPPVPPFSVFNFFLAFLGKMDHAWIHQSDTVETLGTVQRPTLGGGQRCIYMWEGAYRVSSTKRTRL